jgi:ABC-type multidrug transport system ATPase subunit
VLLGHNGAGKTTTISMLIGMIAADAGRMGVFGQDLTTKAGMRALRAQLGVCPQHDVLWPELTVREHLEIFADIKGVPRAARDAEIRRTIAEVGLTEKAAAPSAALCPYAPSAEPMSYTSAVITSSVPALR